MGGVGAVDPLSALLFVSGRSGSVLVYERTASGDAKPLRTIGGPVSGVRSALRIVVHPPTHTVILTTRPGRQEDENGGPVPLAYVAVFDQDASGDVAPLWTVAKGHLFMPRGLTLDPHRKTVIVADKYKNSVMTFWLPEMYEPVAVSDSARAAR